MSILSRWAALLNFQSNVTFLANQGDSHGGALGLLDCYGRWMWRRLGVIHKPPTTQQQAVVSKTLDIKRFKIRVDKVPSKMNWLWSNPPLNRQLNCRLPEVHPTLKFSLTLYLKIVLVHSFIGTWQEIHDLRNRLQKYLLRTMNSVSSEIVLSWVRPIAADTWRQWQKKGRNQYPVLEQVTRFNYNSTSGRHVQLHSWADFILCQLTLKLHNSEAQDRLFL